MSNAELIDVEEFFADADIGTTASMPFKPCAPKPRKNRLFTAIKTKMVMKAYGISYAQARKIVSDCNNNTQEEE